MYCVRAIFCLFSILWQIQFPDLFHVETGLKDHWRLVQGKQYTVSNWTRTRKKSKRLNQIQMKYPHRLNSAVRTRTS